MLHLNNGFQIVLRCCLSSRPSHKVIGRRIFQASLCLNYVLNLISKIYMVAIWLLTLSLGRKMQHSKKDTMGLRPNQSIDRSHDAISKHEQRRLAQNFRQQPLAVIVSDDCMPHSEITIRLVISWKVQGNAIHNECKLED